MRSFFKAYLFVFTPFLPSWARSCSALKDRSFWGANSRQRWSARARPASLDAPGADPLSAKELQGSNVPEGYKPHVLEFFLPLGTLIAVCRRHLYRRWIAQCAVGLWHCAVVGCGVWPWPRAWRSKDLIAGFHDGIKGVVLGSVILLLAITIGGISKGDGRQHLFWSNSSARAFRTSCCRCCSSF